MRLRSALLLILAAAPAHGQTPAAGTLDQLVSALESTRQFSGAIVIGRDGRIVYERGVGWADREARVAFTPATPTDGGSLAKPVTAAAVLSLARDGKLNLDVPAARYVHELPDREITLRQLLTHNGGFPDYGFFSG